MKIYLVGNYAPDRQQSMIRFAEWLDANLSERGFEVVQIRPRVLLNALFWRTSAVSKWIGYIDKFIFFPIWLKLISLRSSNTVFHIVDHSNAYYSRFLPSDRTILTCHDVLAIRGGLGDVSVYCEASKTGRILQRWILKSLQKTPFIVFVSQASKADYLSLPKLSKKKPIQHHKIIHNGLNNRFKRMSQSVALKVIENKIPDLNHQFFFHIGSALPRKNRKNLIEAFSVFLKTNPSFLLVLSGEDLSMDEKLKMQECGLDNCKVISTGGISSDELNALYSLANALVFPSFSEGFGWPVIEAQMCGCPVICSNRTSLPEVAGEAALLFDPGNVRQIADAMQSIQDEETRIELIQKGTENVSNFGEEQTIEKYVALYRTILSNDQ